MPLINTLCSHADALHSIPRWNGHVETIFAAKTRQAPNVQYERRLMQTPDGGTVSLDYHQLPPGKASWQAATVHVARHAEYTGHPCTPRARGASTAVPRFQGSHVQRCAMAGSAEA